MAMVIFFCCPVAFRAGSRSVEFVFGDPKLFTSQMGSGPAAKNLWGFLGNCRRSFSLEWLETPRDPERASVELRQRFPIYEAWIIPESRALLRAQWHQAAARASWPLVVVLLVRLRRAPSAINLGVDAPDEAMEPADDEAGAGRPGFVS